MVSEEDFSLDLFVAFQIWLVTSASLYFFGSGGGVLKAIVQSNTISPFYTLILALGVQTIVYLLAFKYILNVKFRFSAILFLAFIGVTFFAVLFYNYLFGTYSTSLVSYGLSYITIFLAVLLIKPLKKRVSITSKRQGISLILAEDIYVLVLIGIALFGLYYFNYISTPLLLGLNYNNTYSANQSVILTTVNTIKNGRYVSAIDKTGLGGTRVQINDVRVLQIAKEFDGDTHLVVVDSRGIVLDTEYTPISNYYYNQSIGQLRVNSTINIVGFYYCDYVHASEAGHSGGLGWPFGNCAEIHPIIYISSNTIPVTLPGNFVFVQENNQTI